MKKKVKIVIFIYALAVLVYVGVLLFGFVQSKLNRNNLRELSALVNENTSPSPVLTTETSSTGTDITEPISESTSSESTSATEQLVLPKYAALYEKNQDLVGWIKIEDSEIDYPVMFTPDSFDYYLYRDFEQKDSKYGLPFVDYRSSIVPMSTNILVHGHNMKDGSMFATLPKYQSRNYFESHPKVQFDTIYEEAEYEIFAAFMSQVYPADSEEFMYYRFIQAETESAFNDYVQNSIDLSLYDTGIVPEYGDQLLTLSTCSYHVGDGRMVLVARKITADDRGAES